MVPALDIGGSRAMTQANAILQYIADSHPAAKLGAAGASGVPGGSLMLIPMACSLLGIDGQTSAQVIAIGVLIGVIQDSAETALNSSSDVIFTAAAGPTREAIDPVRYLSNHSSGKMGYALAAAAARRGAAVTLISGPTALPTPAGVTRIGITSAEEMLAAALAQPGDIFIAAAAVADYRVAHPAAHKQKKQGDAGLTLQLVQNPDIVATIAALREHRPYTVGFAAETENLLAYARAKRARKNLDLIIANDVSGDVFGADDNSATLISAAREIPLPRQSKSALAESLLDHIRAAYDTCKARR